MATWSLPRKNTYTPEPSPGCTLPEDLLLEIVARSDTRTLVRCAAACKLLRCDILVPSFIRRVTQQGGIVPPYILAHLNIQDDDEKDDDPPPPLLSLVHPATPIAASFLDDHLSPYMSRLAGDLLSEHYTVTSRRGLVLLHRRNVSNELPNLCMYDPITDERTFLPYPADVNPNQGIVSCVLLIAADGICSFLLFAPYVDTKPDGSYTHTVKVQTATSTSVTWASAVTSHDCSGYGFSFRLRQASVVLPGGVIHWMVRIRGEILTYDTRTMEPGRIKLPDPVIGFKGRLHLGSYYSHDGQKLLRLFGVYKFRIYVWPQFSGRDWASEAMVIDTKEKLLQLDPDILPGQPVRIEFKCSGEGSNVVLLHINIYSVGLLPGRTLLVLLDLDTKEMCVQPCSTSSSALLEIDLRSRLRAMKVFP